MGENGPELNKARKMAKIFEWRAEDLDRERKDLKEKSGTDSLTGLLNRRAFETRARAVLTGLSRTMREVDKLLPRNVGIIVGDIDYFKSINDTLGHQEGDRVLKDVARTLKSGVRSEDIVARWGGEEFMVLIVDGSKEQIKGIAEMLRKAVERLEIQVKGRPVTMSFGYDEVKSADDFEAAIARADKALYRAKENGRNRVETLQPVSEAA